MQLASNLTTLFSDNRLLNYHQRVSRLRYFTFAFFLLLFIPVSIIFYAGLNKYEADLLVDYQHKTGRLTQAINKRIFKTTVYANGRLPSEFNYYHHLYNPDNQTVSKVISPLANIDNYKNFAGLVGYFQIDKAGNFNSPVWPHVITAINGKSSKTTDTNEKGEAKKDIAAQELAYKIFGITNQSNELQTIVTEGIDKDVDKFKVLSDVPGYFVFYRTVKLHGVSKLQGYIIKRKDYVSDRVIIVLDYFGFESELAVTVTGPDKSIPPIYYFYRVNKDGIASVSLEDEPDVRLNQLIVNKEKINWPYSGYHLTYSVATIPLSSTAIYGIGVMIVLLLAIALGCYGFYRIGVKQLKLAEQRLNFVSSVSHELKTPLTSIRMYSEMLKTGTLLTQTHQAEYYEFIHSESERLSRLIDNILQLAKLSQPQQGTSSRSTEPTYTKLSVLMDIIQSKVSSLLLKNDFRLNMTSQFEQPDKVMVLVDADAFSQVIINITDNAVKFFDSEKIQDTNRQTIDFSFTSDSQNKFNVLLTIRDYGFGISAEQENKIFDLFYRGGSELTRSTQGTGIGLALVNELMLAQQGTIRVERKSPGLAMNMSFKSRII